MIWDYIRDFLVEYIFGGVTSEGYTFGGYIGGIDGDNWHTSDISYNIGSYSGDSVSISLGDWLSTTATIIVMCLAVFLLIMLVRWVWRLVTSAFLLK